MGLKKLVFYTKVKGGHVSVFMGGFGGENKAGKVTIIAWGNFWTIVGIVGKKKNCI